MARFDGDGTAVEMYAAAKERSRPDARWPLEVGFVESHHNGRLALRGTFAGHYVDVDESDHVSEHGAGVGVAVGVLVGALAGPPGIAVGVLLGGVVGAETGIPSDTEPEPRALVDRLREAVPPSSSAIVLIAPPADVEEMLAALGDDARDVTRRELSDEESAQLEEALSTAPRVAPED
ncbi:MAG: DUF1269 domain-containing protein [Solirubrobacteraceae bacterium]